MGGNGHGGAETCKYGRVCCITLLLFRLVRLYYYGEERGGLVKALK